MFFLADVLTDSTSGKTENGNANAEIFVTDFVAL